MERHYKPLRATRSHAKPQKDPVSNSSNSSHLSSPNATPAQPSQEPWPAQPQAPRPTTGAFARRRARRRARRLARRHARRRPARKTTSNQGNSKTQEKPATHSEAVIQSKPSSSFGLTKANPEISGASQHPSRAGGHGLTWLSEAKCLRMIQGMIQGMVLGRGDDSGDGFGQGG